MMVKQQYTVSFVTPAFLGDAEQNGAWRTPPFKALPVSYTHLTLPTNREV